MALADKKYERLFSTEGSDADKIDNDKFTKIKAKFDNNEYLEDEDSFETLAPILYHLQKVTEEFDSVRDHVVNDVVGTQGPKGDTGATGARGATGATGAAGADGKDGVVDESKLDMSKVDVSKIDMSKLDASTLPSSKPKNKNLLYNDKGTVKVS